MITLTEIAGRCAEMTIEDGRDLRNRPLHALDSADIRLMGDGWFDQVKGWECKCGCCRREFVGDFSKAFTEKYTAAAVR